MDRRSASARAVAVLPVVLLIAGLLWASQPERIGPDRRAQPSPTGPTTTRPHAGPASSAPGPAPSSAGPQPVEGPAPATDGGEAAPSPPAVFEAEQLDGPERVSDADASGGAFARAATIATAPLQVTAGDYLVEARVKAQEAARVDLTVDGAMAGSYRTQAGWQVVRAVVRTGRGGVLGVRSVDAAGDAREVAVDVDWLSIGPASPAPTVRGNQIIGTDGAPYVPKGLNFPFLTGDLDPSGAVRLTDPPVDDLYVWGADAVRIQLNQEYWLADCNVLLSYDRTTTYRAAVGDAVAQLTGRGVHVFLSLLATERGADTGCSVPTRPWLKEMADERSPGFWSSVATTFASNPLVVFDLFNEPHDITDDVWRDGGQVSYTTKSPSGLRVVSSFTAVGMQQLYDTVRNTGATNLISVSGPSWAADPRVMVENPIDGYGIVVGSHAYCNACPPVSPQLNPRIDTNNSPAVLARFPFVITEAGWKAPPDGRYNRGVIDWAAERGVGYLLYAFYLPGGYSLVADWNETFDAGGVLTKPPNSNGVPVWNDLAPTRTERGFEAKPLPES